MSMCETCGSEMKEASRFCNCCGAANPAFAATRFDNTNHSAVNPENNNFAETNQNLYPPIGVSPQDMHQASPPKDLSGSYASAVITSLLLIGFNILLFSIDATNLVGMILGMLCSIGAGICIALGGFYFFIIPLPIIFIYKYGCLKPDQPSSRKALLCTLSIVLPILSFLLMFIFQ